MLRRLMALLCALMLAALPAFALAESAYEYDLIIDDANLLTGEEMQKLNAKAWALSQQSDMEFVVYTAQSAGGKSPEAFADDFYDANGYGYGASKDGVLLCLMMAERDWWISTSGAGIYAFTDYGIQKIGQDIVGYLSNGDYYHAFDTFLDDAAYFAKEAAENQPFDVNHEYQGVPLTLAQKLARALPVGGVLSALVTLIGMGKMKSGLHTAHRKHGAYQYVREGSLQLNRVADIFLYHTVHREHIEQSRAGGGGGSSTHVSSSGATHGGGGGKF